MRRCQCCLRRRTRKLKFLPSNETNSANFEQSATCQKKSRNLNANCCTNSRPSAAVFHERCRCRSGAPVLYASCVNMVYGSATLRDQHRHHGNKQDQSRSSAGNQLQEWLCRQKWDDKPEKSPRVASLSKRVGIALLVV
jgi:hypothetical protein